MMKELKLFTNRLSIHRDLSRVTVTAAVGLAWEHFLEEHEEVVGYNPCFSNNVLNRICVRK